MAVYVRAGRAFGSWPHEAGVAWLRRLMEPGPNCMEKAPLSETIPAFKQRMGRAIRYANKNYDVEGLCTSFPRRIKDLVERKGDRLRK